jgi:hypothetical protein
MDHAYEDDGQARSWVVEFNIEKKKTFKAQRSLPSIEEEEWGLYLKLLSNFH